MSPGNYFVDVLIEEILTTDNTPKRDKMGVYHTTTKGGRTVRTPYACAACGKPAPLSDNPKLGEYLPECPDCGLLSKSTLLPLVPRVAELHCNHCGGTQYYERIELPNGLADNSPRRCVGCRKKVWPLSEPAYHQAIEHAERGMGIPDGRPQRKDKVFCHGCKGWAARDLRHDGLSYRCASCGPLEMIWFQLPDDDHTERRWYPKAEHILRHAYAQDQCQGCGGKAEVDYQPPPDFDRWHCPRCGDLEWRLALWNDTPTQALFPAKNSAQRFNQPIVTHGDGYRDVRFIHPLAPSKPRRTSVLRVVSVGVAIGLTIATYVLTR